MELLLYTIRVRLIGQFFNRPWWRTLLKVLLLLVAGMYAYGFAWLYDIIPAEEPDIHRELLLAGLSVTVLIVTILRGYFPTYQPQQDFIPKLYPVGPFLRYFTGLASELVSIYFLLLLWVIGVIMNASRTFTLRDAVLALSVLYSAHLIRRVVQTHTDRELNRIAASWYLSIALGVAGTAMLAAGLYGLSNQQIWAAFALLAALPVLLGADYLVRRCVIALKTAQTSSQLTDTRSTYLALVLRSKSIRVSLWVSLFFKLIFLGLAAAGNLTGRENLHEKMPIILLLITPVMMFTNVFNNTWGHFRNLWLTMQLAGTGSLGLMMVQLRLLAFPLLLDALISGIFLASLHEKQGFYLLYYLTALLLIFPLSLISSIYQPKLILRFMFMRQPTSVLFAFISFGTVCLLLLPLLSNWLYFGYPVLVGFAWFAAIAVLKEYPRFQYKLYEKLFKTSD